MYVKNYYLVPNSILSVQFKHSALTTVKIKESGLGLARKVTYGVVAVIGSSFLISVLVHYRDSLLAEHVCFVLFGFKYLIQSLKKKTSL